MRKFLFAILFPLASLSLRAASEASLIGNVLNRQTISLNGD